MKKLLKGMLAALLSVMVVCSMLPMPASAYWVCDRWGHQPADGWSTDGRFHWHECNRLGCTDKLDYEVHGSKWVVTEEEHYQVCETCNYQMSTEAAHQFVWVDNGDGTHSYKCSDCGYVDATEEHSKYKWSYSADKHVHQCAICGGDRSNYDSHEYGWTTSDAAHLKVCTICKYRVPGTWGYHTPGDEFIDVGEGYHQAKCSVCGEPCGDKIAHIGNPTCTDADICSACNALMPALGHTGGEETCTSGKICTRCGVEYTDALGHTGGEETCTSGKICTRCGVEYTEALGHTPSTEYVAVTDGHKVKCEVCGELYGDTLDHELGGGYRPTDDNTAHNAVCKDCLASFGENLDHEHAAWHHTADGHVNYCEICDAEYGDVIPHIWSYAAISSAQHNRTCVVCGRVETLSHYYINGTCTDCGYTFEVYTPVLPDIMEKPVVTPEIETHFATATGAFDDVAYFGRKARVGDIVLLKVSNTDEADRLGMDYHDLRVEYRVEGCTIVREGIDYYGDPLYKDGIAAEFQLAKGPNKVTATVYYKDQFAGTFQQFYCYIN